MTTQPWPQRVTESVAAEVKRWRATRKMSAQRLSDRCAELGAPIPRSVLANLEGGRREAVSVAEVLVLAAALEVSPMRLLFPLERPAEPLADVEAPPWAAIEWFNGQHQLPSAPQRADATQLLTSYRQHQDVVVRWRNLRARLSDALARGDSAELWERELRAAENSLSSLRAEFRQQGAIPPSLPSGLAHVDMQSTEAPKPATDDGLLRSLALKGDGSIEEEEP